MEEKDKNKNDTLQKHKRIDVEQQKNEDLTENEHGEDPTPTDNKAKGKESPDDEPMGEDPAVAAYRELITKMDEMESAEQTDVSSTEDSQKTSEAGVDGYSMGQSGEHAPLLLGTLQEEDELLGLNGPERALHTPPPPGNLSVVFHGLPIPSIIDPAMGLSPSRRLGLVESPFIGGRTSPQNGRGSPSPRMLRSGRVSPHQDPPDIRTTSPVSVNHNESPRESKGSITSIIVQPADNAKDGKWAEANGLTKIPNGTNLADEKTNQMRKKSKDTIFFRAFRERASQENFALYGLLTPALCLVPNVDGVSHETVNLHCTECGNWVYGPM